MSYRSAPLFGGLSTQTGAFEELCGPQADALRHAPGVRQRVAENYYGGAFGGDLGHFLVHGVQSAPLVGPGYYGGMLPNDPLAPQLERTEPWTDPAGLLR